MHCVIAKEKIIMKMGMYLLSALASLSASSSSNMLQTGPAHTRYLLAKAGVADAELTVDVSKKKKYSYQMTSCGLATPL